MSHTPHPSMAPDEPPTEPVRNVRAGMVGAVVAEALWAYAFLGAYAFREFESLLPAWVDALGSICALIAAPLALGGWLLVWGDNGPPHHWLSSVAFNVAFALAAYGLLGFLTGAVIGNKLKRLREGE